MLLPFYDNTLSLPMLTDIQKCLYFIGLGETQLAYRAWTVPKLKFSLAMSLNGLLSAFTMLVIGIMKGSVKEGVGI